MQKRTREIIGLALLVVLGFGVACVMGWYILVGHNWNVTASNIDDSIGQMDGYTIILFEGTVNDELRKTAEEGSSARAGGGSSPEGERSHEDAAPSSKSEAAPSASGASTESVPSDGSARPSGDDGPTIDEVRQSYQEKGAAVFYIDPSAYWKYDEPFVVAKEGKRVGFCAISEPARVAQARVDIKLLERQGSSFNVLMTDDGALSSASIRGLNVVVCSSQQGLPGKGRWVGSTYCVDAPYTGEVQAIIVSPSGVISTKTIDTL